MKRLSSRSTFFYKLISSLIFIVPGIFVFARALLTNTNTNNRMVLILVTFWLAIHLGIDWYNNFPIKKVELGEEGLYISNYLWGTLVPLSDIRDAEQKGGSSSWRWLPQRVTLRLRNPSVFGTTIKFIPHSDLDAMKEIEQARNRCKMPRQIKVLTTF